MWLLSKFIFKRDKVGNLFWILGIVLLNVAVAAAFNEMFSTPEELMGMIQTLDNPAMVAMLGPLYGHTIAAVFAQNMLVFVAIAVGIMNIFLVSRHTRADEEDGRLEVLRSLPISRTTILKSVYVNVALLNVVIALLTGIGLAIVGIEAGGHGTGLNDINGAFLFGAILGATGLIFAAATALFVQLSANNKTVLGYSFIFLGIVYMLRAMGDMNAEILSLISPLGLIFRTEVFVRNNWLPVIIIIIISIIIACIAIILNNNRDLGAGFIAEKPGRAHGGKLLKNPFGLAVKLTKGSVIGWAITLFILGASYGSIFGDIDSFVASNEMFSQIFYGVDPGELAIAFVSFIVVMMAAVVAVPVVQIILRLKTEEKKNRLEHLYSRGTSRTVMMFIHMKIAAVVAALLLFLLGFGMYVASYAVMDEALNFSTMITSVMVYLPTLWIFLGVAMLCVGLSPKLTNLAWGYLGYSFVISYFGQILDVPEWLMYTTPLGFVPNYPMEEINFIALIMLVAISVVLAVIGTVSYRKRDIIG